MKTHLQNFRSLAVKALAFCLCASGCGAENPSTTQIDQLFGPWHRPDSPGAALVIAKDGTVVCQRSYGWANLEHSIPVTAETVFDVGSMSKQFTGLAVAMLAEQGKLSLDDDIRKHLADVPDFGKPITIRQLLHHTSGLPDWPNLVVLSGIAPEELITSEMILELVRRQRELNFVPGDEFLYCSTGYNLLAAVVTKVTGQSFRTWTDANLFQPLGMKRTHVCDDSAEVVAGRADSYAPHGQGSFQRMTSQLAAPGAGSVLTTAEDMGKWLLNFETARIGGKSAIEAMQRSGKLNNGANVDYGFGVFVSKWSRYRGMTVVSHRGDWAGFHCIMLRVPEERFAVVLLSNAANLEPLGLAAQIADLYLGNSFKPTVAPSPSTPPQKKPDPPKLTAEQLAAYVGDYWSEEMQLVFHVEIRRGQLRTWHRLTGWVQLLPAAVDRFDAEAKPPLVGSARPFSAMEFTRSGDSAVSGMKLSIPGGRVRAPLRFVRVSLPRMESR